MKRGRRVVGGVLSEPFLAKGVEVGVVESALTDAGKMMLADIWADLDLHESVRGIRGKFALVGNTWRARWKYRHFTDMSWMRALWIQGKGVVFEKEAKLD